MKAKDIHTTREVRTRFPSFVSSPLLHADVPIFPVYILTWQSKTSFLCILDTFSKQVSIYYFWGAHSGQRIVPAYVLRRSAFFLFSPLNVHILVLGDFGTAVGANGEEEGLR